MQPGDVVAPLLIPGAISLVGFSPSTTIEVGILHFAKWFRDYYQL